MLTLEWFDKEMPQEINSNEDYNKLLRFLNNWPIESECAEKAYDFITNISKDQRSALKERILQLACSFLKFQILKANFITAILKDNAKALSNETKSALINYGNYEFNRSENIATALKLLSKMFI